jgi:hypothetical protein
VLSHPLWHPREGAATDAQIDAKYDLGGMHCEFADVRDLEVHAPAYMLKLRGA